MKLKNSKSLFMLICCFILVFSAFGLETAANASNSWVDNNLVIANDQAQWNGREQFLDTELITRAELSAIVAQAIGMVYAKYDIQLQDVDAATDYANRISAVCKQKILNPDENGYFYPDAYISKEELAIVAVRTYNAISQSPAAAAVTKESIKDFDEISAWAVDSVFAALALKAIDVKNATFEPQKTVTRAEAMQAIFKVSKIKMFDFTPTVRRNTEVVSNTPNAQASSPSDSLMQLTTQVSGDNVLKDRDMGAVTPVEAAKDMKKAYDVYQTVVVNNQMGYSGAYIKARFDESEAIELFVSRTTTIPEKESSAPFAPSSYIRISDPNGNLAGFYDFSDMETGKSGVILKPSVKASGIWTFQFIGGRTGDKVELAFSKAKSWGIAGTPSFFVTETTPKQGFIYAPRTAKELHVFSSTQGNLSLYDDDNKAMGAMEAFSSAWFKYKLVVRQAKPDSVYKLVLSDNFRETLAVDMVPSLICPTKEMALDLKGGWVENNGILTQGPLQARCRQLAVDIVNNQNLKAEIGELPELPETIENVMAEAQMFGKYGPISGLNYAFDHQILNINDYFLGYVASDNVIQGKEVMSDFQAGEFTGVNVGMLDAMSAAYRIPAKLNYYYKNEALLRRCELYLLSSLVALSEDMYTRENRIESGTTGTTHGGFYLKYITHAFQLLKPYLPKEDLAIIEETMIALTDAQQNYRGYVTNQMQHATEGILCMYISTGLEHYHEAWKRQIKTVINPAKGWEYFGFNQKVGYFVEAYGCDGNYSWLNNYFFDNMYREYRELETADTEVCAAMLDVIDKYLKFESFFWLTSPLKQEAEYPMPTSFTSRTNSAFGYTNGYPHIERVMDIMPLAKRRQELISYNHSSSTFPSSVFPHLLNSEDWAYQHIKEHYYDYDKKSNGNPGGWTTDLYQVFYDAYHGEGKNLESAQIPCEMEDQVWKDRPGFIAFKHKGVYGYSFFEFDEAWGVPKPSYLGGGPTALWGENVGGTLISKKHPDYNTPENIKSADKVQAVCVYGTDSSGNFIFNGKEHSTLKWIKDNEIWEISGTIPNTSQTVTWRYELVDTGLKLTVSLSSPKGGNLWLNLPLYVNKNGTALEIVNYKEGQIEIGKGDQVMTYKWDSDKSELAPAGDTTQCMHIQFPKNGKITLDISCR